MPALTAELDGRVGHHDQDGVYTRCQWFRTILLEVGMKASHPENGAMTFPD